MLAAAPRRGPVEGFGVWQPPEGRMKEPDSRARCVRDPVGSSGLQWIQRIPVGGPPGGVTSGLAGMEQMKQPVESLETGGVGRRACRYSVVQP